jgi:hypothetical protein
MPQVPRKAVARDLSNENSLSLSHLGHGDPLSVREFEAALLAGNGHKESIVGPRDQNWWSARSSDVLKRVSDALAIELLCAVNRNESVRGAIDGG